MLTVNQAMSLQKAVQSRLGQLRSLRSEVAVKKDTTYPWNDSKEKIEIIEPQFDVKAVDKKITELELVLFKMDAAIKQSNALTELDLEVDVDKLLEPLT